MSSNFEELLDPAVPRIPLIAHVPHSATTIPAEYRDELVINDAELARELLLMTDRYTDELAMSVVSMGGVVFRNRYSRLVMDPERFAQDSKERMASRGMGAVYLSRHDGTPLRGSGFTPEQRARVMSALYDPYHRALEALVGRMLDQHGVCFIVDVHSYPRVALPYEDVALARPALCIGYEDAHVDAPTAERWLAIAQQAGIGTGTNTPFPGSFVPLRFHGRDRQVRSMMIELRRDLYMDEATGEKTVGYEATRRLVRDLIEVAALRVRELEDERA